MADSTAPGWLHVPYEGRDVLVFDDPAELAAALEVAMVAAEEYFAA